MADASTVTLGDYQIEIATQFGPRVIGLRRRVGPQILASLGPDVAIEHPGGMYRFHGGHRLWAAPENAEVTYANDDHPCQVDIDDDSATILAGSDSAGVRKEITLRVDGDSLVVDHSISWQTESVHSALAAWAITQFPLGGVALMPIGGVDTGSLPNRQLVYWPYTNPADERIHYNRDGVSVKARGEHRLKLGVGPTRVRLGYLRESWLFTKEVLSSSVGTVPDLGAGSQVYVGQGFCELESLSGLDEGLSAQVTERWGLHPCAALDDAWAIVTGGNGQ